MIDLDAVGIRSCPPDRGRRDWSIEAQAPVSGNRRRMRGRRGINDDRTLVCASLRHASAGHTNILVHAGGFNLGRHASSDRDRHAARAAGPRGRGSCDVIGAGVVRASAHPYFVVASTHPGRARSARVTDHVCRQLVSGDHLHHGLLRLHHDDTFSGSWVVMRRSLPRSGLAGGRSRPRTA